MLRSLIFLLALAVPAAAQVTLDDLKAEVDARVSTLSTFEDALADPDPRRALAAMQIMIEKGDPDQRRLAIRSGLYSTDLAIRSTVLRAILNSEPNLIVNIEPVGEEVNQYYGRTVAQLNGTLKPDMTASIVRKIGKWDADRQCWLNSRNKDCWVTLNADVVSFYVDSWAQLTLDKEGNLAGPANFSQTAVMMTVPLAE
ncbi:hypothetical protein [Paracoccus salsus]|uniref:hypothetical protein n=1 Tax=Paracoccus salsus TaxID=2911061 RepID=UPI001F183497|nr:hypothetical protein [Paracoccus salsus]MCF3972593.1 hypothetical protein [Paracoccus salsus]